MIDPIQKRPQRPKSLVRSFLHRRTKGLITTGISMAALFGVLSAGVLTFYPEKLTDIKDALMAHASSEYKLPNSPLPSSAAAPADVAFLKSFSRVFSTIAKEARPALVVIVSEKKVTVNQGGFPDDFFFPFLPPEFGGPGRRKGMPPKQGMETDAGSGFLVDLKNGYVMTNNHVIDGADKITVTTYDNKKYKAKVLGTAQSLDVAILKLEEFKSPLSLKQLYLADSDKVEVGDWAVALGAPFELPQTLTMGVVSAVKRSSDVLGINGPNSFIQTDAPINPGNSGGPLLNLEGQVIGMNTAIYSKNGTSVGIGFAIPANTIRLVADSLVNHGKITTSYLGVEMYDINKFDAAALKEMKIDPNTEGGLVMRVVLDSPAAKAGLQPYDIIQNVNGVAVKSPSDIQAQIVFLKPGSVAQIGVLRNGQQLTLKATVSEVPKNLADASSQAGAGADNAPQKTLAAQYGFLFSKNKPATGHGVLIERVLNGTLAEMAGLQNGDVLLEVNKKSVSKSADVESILKAAKSAGSNTLFLLVERNGSPIAVILQTNN